MGREKPRETDMPKTRTLIFYPALAPYRVDMFNALAERLDLRVVFMRENVSYQKYDQERLLAACRFDFDFLTRGLDFGIHMIRFGVARQIRNFKPEVVASPEYGVITQALGLRRRLGAPWGLAIFTEDNATICAEDGRLRSMLRRRALKSADRLFVYSQAARRAIAEQGLMPADAVTVSPNIQDEASLRRRLREALPLAARRIAEYGLAGRRIALCVGRLVPQKGMHRLIAAFARVASDMPDATLALVGEGGEAMRLSECARREGVADRVLFAGHCEGDALLAWYALGHAFGLVSDFEPYGAVVNESLLSGMPVVCSARAGAADLIRTDAQGRVVDPYDIAAIADALRTLLQAAPPLSPNAPDMKPSLMPMTFAEAADALAEGMTLAARKAQT